MLLSLLILFLFISFTLIFLGLHFKQHTELSLIGFVFLFLLSFLILNHDISYVTGENLSYHCVYSNGTTQTNPNCGNNATLYPVTKQYQYTNWDGGGTFSHIVGYWMAFSSVIAFIAVLLSLRKQRWE